MADFPTSSDLFRIGRDEVLVRNSALSSEVINRPGTDANALVAAGSAVGDECIGQLASVQAAAFLSSSRRKNLDRKIFDEYQLARKSAAPARCSATFSTTLPAVASFNIPENTRLVTSDGKEFYTLSALVFIVGTTVAGPVDVQSVLSGANQTIKIGELNNISSPIASSPADLVVTNAAASFGAAEDESDDSYRDRGRSFYSTARRGTLLAVEQAALTVAGVTKAQAFEALDTSARPARIVELVIADTFTEQLIDTSVSPPAYEVQALAIVTEVDEALREVRAGGMYVAVTTAITVLQGVALTLRFRAGTDQAGVANAARASIVNYINSLNPGAPFVLAAATRALRTVPGLVVTGTEIADPRGDVVPNRLEVLRTSLGLVLIASTGSA